MRELKFRAWDGQRMRYDVSVKDGIAQWREGSDAVLSHKVMQYTGLHDKNGREIYEGDIVYHESSVDAHIYCVVWDYPSAALVLRHILNDDIMLDAGVPTVIGNIYANKGVV